MRGSSRSSSSLGQPSAEPPAIPQLRQFTNAYPQVNLQASSFPVQMNNGAWKKQLPPGLDESPYQKVFIASLEEFEANLKSVSWITVVALVLGLCARGVGHSNAGF